jgi:glycosyltransferase involved in cell wall biosynthesis
MNVLCPVLVSRRFWPQVGGAETVTAALACGLRDLGLRPQIVTASQDATWPLEVTCRDVPVHRIWYPRFRWGRTRYLIGLSRFLRQRQHAIDVVCVSRWGEEAGAVVNALAGSGVPVVVRAEPDDALVVDRQRVPRGRAGRSRDSRCLQAAAIVATTTARQTEVLELGADPRRVFLIPNGVPALAARSAERKAAARRALAEVNDDLRVPLGQPVALCLGRLDRVNQWDVAVAAWQTVAERWPFARLWIVGDGPERENLYRQVRAADLLGRVVLPGTFDAPDDLLFAADVLVAPTTYPKESVAVVEAAAAGMPVILTAESGHADLIPPDLPGARVPGGDARALAAAVLQHFQDREAAEAAARTIRDRVRVTRSWRTMAAAHAKLFRHVAVATVRPAR